jgi:hypothetical protein
VGRDRCFAGKTESLVIRSILELPHWNRGSTAQSTAKVTIVLCAGVLAAAVLFLLIVFSPHHMVYDETYHVRNASEADRAGWMAALTSDTNYSAAGPLFVFVQHVCAPFTKLFAPAIRYPNFILFVGFIFFTAATARTLGLRYSLIAAVSSLGVPLLWASVGMALTEMPALFCYSVSLWAVVELDQHSEQLSKYQLFGLMAAAGVLLGLACLGRQTYLAVLPSFVALCRLNAASIVRVAWIVSLALATCGWLFFIWKGIEPPFARSQDIGLKWSSGVLSFAYIALATVFINPRWFGSRGGLDRKMPWIDWVPAAVVAFVALVLPVVKTAPAESLVRSTVSPALFDWYLRIMSAVLVGLAALWLTRFVQELWLIRRDRIWIYIFSSLLLFAITPIKITHQFSSRYVVNSLGLLTLVLWRKPPSIGAAQILRFALGTILGAMILRTYYAQ